MTTTQGEVHVNFRNDTPSVRLFSEPTLSSYDSDSSIENLGIKPLHSSFLEHRCRPSTALAKKKRPNLKLATEATKKHLRVTKTISRQIETDGLTWIKAAFSQKKCCQYADNNGVCFCGKSREEHHSSNADATTWSSDKNCIHEPTNALGKFQLFSKSPHVARFIKLSDESDCNDILELLKNVWHLNMPGIVLSVIGSDDTAIPHKLHQIIQRDIAKVGRITRAWIVSNGIKRGVSRILGAMLSSYGFPMPAIAFCSWGGLQNSSCLEVDDLDPNQLVHYDFKDCDEDKVLDPNHTHFLLVDNGTSNFSKCHEKLRKEFEEYLGKNLQVPLLYILIGGSEEDGRTSKELLRNGFDVILIKGTGGFTDDYCDFQKHIELAEDTSCTCLKGEACETYKAQMHHNFELELLIATWNSRDHIHVYDYHDSSDFDSFILSLLITNQRNSEIDEQLNIACQWSRLDVAEKIIASQIDATTGAKYCSGLTKTLFHALLWDHQEFCGILIENGADIYDIQANISSLYEAAHFSPRCQHVVHLLEKYGDFQGTGPVTQTHINLLLERLIGANFCACTGNEQDPYFDLTLWAATCLRRDQAMLLWRYTQDPVRSALVVLLLLQGMKSNAYLERDDDKRRTKEMFTLFEDLTLSVVNQAWLSDSETCKRAMLSKWNRLNGYNYLDMAFHAHARSFMAHSACQEVISCGWRGQFKRDTSFIRIVIIILLPFLCVTPLVPFDRKVNYRRAIQGKYKMRYEGKVTGFEAIHKRASAFYSAPVAKFWMFLLTYMLFLGFHSYTLLYEMVYLAPGVNVSWTEIVVWLWLGSMIISETVDCVESYANKYSKMTYFSNSWNRIDATAITIYIIGIAFRVQENETYFFVGRTLIACDTVVLFLRLLTLFEYKLSLGPILLMIREMCKDVLVFVILLVICLLGFGVAYASLVIPPTRFTWESLSAIFVYPYFQMFGEFYIEVFEKKEESDYIRKEGSDTDPSSKYTVGQSYVAMALLVFWLILSAVTLVNLLIAMFSDTYRCIKDNQLTIWKYQRYRLLSEYRASYVPPPFSFLHYLFKGIRLCVRKCKKRRKTEDSKTAMNNYWKDCMIRTFMQDARDEFLSQEDSRKDNNQILNKLNAVEGHLRVMRRVGNRTSSLYA